MKYKCISQRAKFISYGDRLVVSDTVCCGAIIDDAVLETKCGWFTIRPTKVSRELEACIGLNYLKEDFVELDTVLDNEDKFVWKEENKMELKELSKENLKEAKKQFDTEKANEEIEFAKKELRRINDRIDTLNREIKVRQDDLDTLNLQLKVFK